MVTLLQIKHILFRDFWNSWFSTFQVYFVLTHLMDNFYQNRNEKLPIKGFETSPQLHHVILNNLLSNNTKMLFLQFCWITIWLPRRSPLSTYGGKLYCHLNLWTWIWCFIDVGDGCWRSFVLVTRLRCLLPT